ncbi:MAG: hypothetical protein KF805_00450 [Phycisphaeraceae bacterium]|nr:hypothetical protein [Phycisphaeraceae bacterium]
MVLANTLRRACSRQMSAIGVALWIASACAAQVTATVTFSDSSNLLSFASAELESHIKAASDLWAQRFDRTTELWIDVRPMSSGTVQYEFVWSHCDTFEGFDVFESGVSTHIRNGYPASSFDPDIIIHINPAFVSNDLWFENDPQDRNGTIDPMKLDAVSIFVRGFGHCLGFAGWKDATSNSYPGNMGSKLDRRVSFDGIDFWFNGANAAAVYGGAVPITYGNPFYVGNPPPRPGSELMADVMNGGYLLLGVKYSISELDRMMLRDIDVPVSLPCPWDFNDDGFIDDVDFGLFVDSYDLLECEHPSMPPGCPADFNHDGIVDDPDFLAFYAAYENLICPF